MSYDSQQLRRIIEGAVLAAGEAMSVDRLHGLFEEYEAPEKSEIRDVLNTIAADCEGRGFHLVEVASGWRFQVREDVATWVNRLWEEKPQKYSRAMLETLALIAYRQPLTRGDIEDVRGVAVSSQIIRTLVEREWVKVVGHRDVPGRPSLYATTRHFLDYFNLKSLDELPTLSELKDIDSINGSLDFQEDTVPETSADAGADPEFAADDIDAPADEESSAAARENGEDFSVLQDSVLQKSVQQDSTAELDSAADVAGHIDQDSEQSVETLAGDTLTEGNDDEVPVQSVEIPVLFDRDATLPTDTAVVADAEPTLEQEEFAEAQRAQEEGGPDSRNREQEEPADGDSAKATTEPDYSHDSLFSRDQSSSQPLDKSSDPASAETDEPSANSSDKQSNSSEKQ